MTGSAIDNLRARLGSRVTTPLDAGYDTERATFNATVQRRPAAIVRVHSDDEIAAAIGAAGELGLPIAVRGGGHNVAGHAVADGSLVVDLRDMRTVTVDPVRRIARVAGGAQWDDVDAPAWAHHLAVVGGTFGDTGVGGLTLGGGIGWLMGTQGLTCDNLVRAEVMTSSGERVVAGVDGDPELLWALRGGGGNFGVVTTFEFQLADPGQITGGSLVYPLRAAELVSRRVAEVAATAPDELSLFIVIRVHDDAIAPTPSEVSVGIAWTGHPGKLDAVLAPLRQGMPLASDSIGPMSYLDIQAMSGRIPFGLRHYWKGHFLRTLGEPSIAGIVEALDGPPGAMGAVLIESIRGVARREPEGGAAFGQRAANWNATALGIWADPAQDELQVAWARRLADRLRPDSLAGAGYANYAPVDETPERVQATFGPDRYHRLAAVKRRYDPDNRFRFNLNIPPGPAPAN